MMAQLRGGAGIFAALDQSGGSTAATLESYGISEDCWTDDEQMFDHIHQMRVRVMAAPSFTGRSVLAAILFEDTMNREADGQPVPGYLSRRGIASFLKIDKGLEPERDGVQLMRPLDDLDGLLGRATSLGVVGTKMRSVIRRLDPVGIAAVVEQQFRLAERVIDAGLLPILEPEVSIGAPNRVEAERTLVEEIADRLDALTGRHQVMLKLTIPQRPDTYAPLVAHDRVARVLALSGGYSRVEACARLSTNHGLIASFSRALLNGLRYSMDDVVFDRALGDSIAQIHAASTFKC
ncbi:fructose bisphosphate aldolase [Sphingomonas glacialis]|nr:fructose bisphosphate aldolase [Sphingomonas glacialis]